MTKFLFGVVHNCLIHPLFPLFGAWRVVQKAHHATARLAGFESDPCPHCGKRP